MRLFPEDIRPCSTIPEIAAGDLAPALQAHGRSPVPIKKQQQKTIPEIARQLSRRGAHVTLNSSGLGLGADTAHWTELTGWRRSRTSRRRSCPSAPRLEKQGPGPSPAALTSAHHLWPPEPGPWPGFSKGAHGWRVSTSPRRPEVQQNATVWPSRTCRLLSSSLSLTPGRGELLGLDRPGVARAGACNQPLKRGQGWVLAGEQQGMTFIPELYVVSPDSRSTACRLLSRAP